MWKIIFKNIFAFVALFIAFWGVNSFIGFIIVIPDKSPVFSYIYISFLFYIPQFLLGIGYAYLLFSLFKSNKRCFLIMIVNAVILIILFCVAFYLEMFADYILDDSLIFEFLLTSVNTIAPMTIALALVFKNMIKSRNLNMQKKLKKKIINSLLIFSKSAFCFVMLTIIMHVYLMLRPYVSKAFGFYGSMFDLIINSIQFVCPLMAIAYGFTLYRLVRKYIYNKLFIIINATFLIALWGFFVISGMLSSEFLYVPGTTVFTYITIYVNAGILTIVLTFMFGSVEKYGLAKSETEITENSVKESI
ncbi:MAG: hypothetical protein WDA65_00085 [Christensenellales bacterium]